MNDRQARLAQLAELHGRWSVEHEKTRVPDKRRSRDKGLHHVDLASPADAEAEFQREAAKIFPRPPLPPLPRPEEVTSPRN